MFIPWIGMFEQVRLADVFVHYDDVQMPQGRNFIYRVQIKTREGQKWLSAQVDRRASGKLISETILQDGADWRDSHRRLLETNYRSAPHYEQMMEIASDIYAFDSLNIARFNQYAIEYIAEWLGLKTKFAVSSKLSISGKSTRRLVDICRHYGATNYVTGHGAANYLEHDLFEQNEISVSYMHYEMVPYEQLFGSFIPYVSILDAIANQGEGVRQLLVSGCVNWKEFVSESH
jgi:hypothetical protein